MKKNYYDILQINRNASPEIIEKAYKTLAKKYHPDLQPEEKKFQAGETLKQINEAYEVLSDSQKKQEYDNWLMETTISQEQFNQVYQENQQLKNKLNHIERDRGQENQIFRSNYTSPNNQSNYTSSNNTNAQTNNSAYYNYEQELQNARKKAYYDAYIQDLKNRGYKIRYKKTFKDYLKNFFALLLTIVVLIILWHIPFVQNFLISIYEGNPIIKLLVDAILNAFK